MSVDAILTASFLRAGERLRVTAQLLDVRTGEILWSESIDGDASDIIAVQDTMVQEIVEGLRLELSPEEKVELAKGSTSDAAASEEYLRGRNCLGQFIYHTVASEHIDSAIKHFRRAIELDPNFALAYSALGGCYVNRALKGLGEAGDHEKAESAFSKALALDPKLLETRMHMAFIYLHRGEKPKARQEVERLREEYPNDVGVHFVRGVLARLDGEYDRALRSFDRMVRLNPAERVVASYNRARIFNYRKQYEEALAELDEGAKLEPDHPLIRTFRALVLYYRGEVTAATRILEQVLEQHPQMDGIRPILAICLSAQGKHREADEQLTEKVRGVAANDHDIAYWLATAYLLQGRQVEAFRWLETAIDLGNENYPWFESDLNWSGFNDDPRFLALMQRIKSERLKTAIENKIPREHLEFFRERPFYHEDEYALYVHAGLEQGKHPRETSPQLLLWSRDMDFYKNYRGKPCLFGHTPTAFLPLRGRVGRHGIYIFHSAIGIDTGYNHSSPLSCLSLPDFTLYQSFADGREETHQITSFIPETLKAMRTKAGDRLNPKRAFIRPR
ncbi:MAG: tetratricopeptide repeat protein [Acidobacteria bacterium]|nr:tetratricopeptide repeat protein [Acidobacteriota bacterium]